MGGNPVELLAMSLGEVLVNPSTMLYRSFLAMETEELLRSLPVDGAVLLGGCDKTTPGMLMGAISMDIPVIFCPAGPMPNGKWRGTVVGAGTHTRKYWDEKQGGNITGADWIDLESRMTRSIGTCDTMGTASTMTSIVDAMRLTLPGASSIPAVDSAHVRMASA
ncbi:MAG: dihydroxy-acid dehydratase domain-containing protein [Acidiphilium sp.]